MDEDAYADAWRRASSLVDAGELVATFLEVPMQWTPTHGGPPDPETQDLVAVLAAVNRAGFVTDHSQPGEIDDTADWRQRASVSGYCDLELVEPIRSLEFDSDLVVAAHPPGVEDGQLGWVITTWNGEANTWDGMPTDHGSLRQWYGEVAPHMVDVLVGAWQVSVVDPHWGRNDLLWPRLLDAVTRQGA